MSGCGPTAETVRWSLIAQFCRTSMAAYWAEVSPLLTPEQKMVVEQEKEKNPALRSIIP